MADGGRTSNGRHEAQLVTPFELLRQTSSRESDDLITPFELLRQTAGKSPTRPHKREEPRKLVGLSSLPNPPSPKSSPSGSSSDPPSSPHKADTIVPQLPVHAMLRRKSDPKSPSSPLATSAISIEDAPSPPMSPTSPTKANDGSRPSSPNNLRLPEPAYLRRVAAERSRKGSRIISFLDTVAPSTPHAATNGTHTTPAMPIQAAGDFLGISRRRTRSMAQALAPCQWTHGDAAHFAVLSEQFDKFLSRRQVAPPRLVRQRTRTMAFAGVPVLSSTPPGHTRRCSLPLDFGVRAAEPIISSESAPLIAVSSSGGSISSGSASTVTPAAAASPPQSPTSRSKSEKKAKKEKKSRSRKSGDENEDSRRRPSSDGAPLDRSSSAGVVNPDVFEAADLHSYIVTLLSPHLNSTLQSFRDNIDHTILAYRNYATPIELAASIHAIWTFCVGMPPSELQQQEQNIIYFIGRWVSLNYESEFQLDSGQPDAVNQKALSELIGRMPDDAQLRFKQLLEEAQRESRQLSVFSMPPRKKGKVPIGLKKADIAIVALLDTSDLARCLTLLDWETLLRVRRIEMLSKAYPHILKSAGLPTLTQVTAKWNAVQTWVTAEIVTAPKLKHRVAILERFIALAAALLDEQQNYHSFFAVMLGMKDSCVQRMKATWKKLSSGFASLFAKLDRLTDLTGGYKVYRASIKELRRQKLPAIVPFMVVPISDLVLLSNVPDHVAAGGVASPINWSKTANVGRVLADFEDMRRACRRALTEAVWSEADVAIMRTLPQLRVERFERLTDDFLFAQSKLNEPSVIL